MIEIKNSINGFIDRLNHTEELSAWKIKLKKYCRSQPRKIEKENMTDMLKEMGVNVRRPNIYLIRVSKG